MGSLVAAMEGHRASRTVRARCAATLAQFGLGKLPDSRGDRTVAFRGSVLIDQGYPRGAVAHQFAQAQQRAKLLAWGEAER